MTKGIFLLLGSNLGDKRANLETALTLIKSLAGQIVQHSKIYQSEAWGKTSQPVFLNQVIMITSPNSPFELLSNLKKIEKNMGRVKYDKWGERLIDIDILYFSNLIIDQPQLTIPHPQITKRRFALTPLVEIAASFIHPIEKLSNHELLKICPDKLKVWPFVDHYMTSK